MYTLPKERKLDQVLGLAVYVSAHVADEGVLIISVGVEGAERRAGDAGEVAEFEHGGGHDSTGIACANEGVYLAFFEGLDAYINSRVGFLDDGASGVFIHANDLGSRQDTNLTIKGNAIAGGFRLEALRIAYQNDLYLWCQAGQGRGPPLVRDSGGRSLPPLCLSQCASDFVLRRSQDFFAPVIAALEIDAVKKRRLATLRVYIIGWGGELVVGASFVPAAFGMTSLRIGHSGAKVRGFLGFRWLRGD
jgi:hypothetical protein